MLDQSEVTENQIGGFSDEIKNGPAFTNKGKMINFEVNSVNEH